MNARARTSSELTPEKVAAEVRELLSHRFAKRQAKLYDMGEIFAQSQKWDGFTRAFESWHKARWALVDQTTPASVVERVNAIRADRADWSKATKDFPDGEKPWIMEVIRQQYLLRRALFLWAMGGVEATCPDTYQRFSSDMETSKRIGDDSFFQALARQKQQKPTKDKGDRRLKYLLLLNWIPGCLWAFTADGIAQFLNSHYPRSDNALYKAGTIANACQTLKLNRPIKPHWWGFEGEPPRLASL